MMGKRGGKRWLRKSGKQARQELSYVKEARRMVFDHN